jgi:hypothetical protein
MTRKDEALTRIESHEKLCRIMQKQTHDKIKSIEEQIKRIEKIMIVCAGVLLAGMASVILMLVDKI